MVKRQEANGTKIKAAVDSLLSCLEAVEAALRDLQSSDIQFARFSAGIHQPSSTGSKIES
jgi:hypothetical protein